MTSTTSSRGQQAAALSQVIVIQPRFRRSINLALDFGDAEAVRGYIVTPAVRRMLERMVDALSDSQHRSRAWSVVGPYGSGKSALALFVAELLQDIERPSRGLATEVARQILKDQHEELYRRLFDRRRRPPLRGRGLLPVFLSGTREPMCLALLRALEKAVESFWAKRGHPKVLGEIHACLARAERGDLPSASEVTALFERTADKVCSGANSGAGLLVVVDELGKFLEYAASAPDGGDIFVLQTLAESATRSGGRPILLLTLLHQAFDQYAARSGESRRAEWMKVQGRFEDVAFHEAPEQALRLVAKAIDFRGGSGLHRRRARWARRHAEQALRLGLCPAGVSRREFRQIIEDAYPLHPVSLLALPHLFYRYAQNERSLFAFLSAHEPNGMQEFLVNTELGDSRELPSLGPHLLYQYFLNIFGSGLGAQPQGRRWTEVEAALDRLPDLSPLEARLIQTVGLLAAIGDKGCLRASTDVLIYTLADGDAVNARAVRRALKTLTGRGALTFRRFADAYRLWEGSDLDLDALMTEGRRQATPTSDLVDLLDQYEQPRPISARRHSFQTGTLRYFDVRYVDVQDVARQVEETDIGESDGLVMLCLPKDREEASRIEQLARASNDPRLIFGIARNIGTVREAALEVASIRWVESNTPELAGDVAARNELKGRLLEARSRLAEGLKQAFAPGLACRWLWKGEVRTIRGQKDLSQLLSRACDEAYPQTPRLWNELVNRRQLSSSAAAARRNLVEAMFLHPDQDHLGIEGYPPERAIYDALLARPGIHRRDPETGLWGFFPPDRRDDIGIQAVWQASESYFAKSEGCRLPVKELFDQLARPPFGLKAGPLPVLLAAALLHYGGEVALYENGSFVPAPEISVFERLMKTPESFAIKRSSVTGMRAVVVKRFANAFALESVGRRGRKDLLDVIRPLCQFAARLPPYAQHTRRLSKVALEVRLALLSAREPDQLLFEQIPGACGLAPIGAKGSLRGYVDSLFAALRGALRELQQLYDNLLGDIERALVNAFGLPEEGGEVARRVLRRRSQLVMGLTADVRLKSFLTRALDEEVDFRSWIESIGTLLCDKPPARWTDDDQARFDVEIADLSRRFVNFERLALGDNDRLAGLLAGGEFAAYRVGLTRAGGVDLEHVFYRNGQDDQVEAVAETLLGILEKPELRANPNLQLAALARALETFLSRNALERPSPVTEKRKGSQPDDE